MRLQKNREKKEEAKPKWIGQTGDTAGGMTLGNRNRTPSRIGDIRSFFFLMKRRKDKWICVG